MKVDLKKTKENAQKLMKNVGGKAQDVAVVAVDWGKSNKDAYGSNWNE